MNTNMKITDGKGVHFSFENGATISIQIGGGNYSDNYDFPIGEITRECPLPASGRAEIAVWDANKNWANLNDPDSDYEDVVAGYVPLDEIIDLVPIIRAIPVPATKETIEAALCDWRKRNAQ